MDDELTRQEIDTLREAFVLFDTNKSGSVDREELLAIIKSLNDSNYDEKDNEQTFQKFDVDGNGTIDFPEFLTLMLPRIRKKNQPFIFTNIYAMLDQNWKLFSEDQSGKLNP
ncbi:hypothetical protein BLNAU_888 [Blattamonas nauphoetae]|uniref:EF-hand domain-containing protein n=1 Tax=Blattamonas nauphoetae TaxID=2049346 RepID=A0ABQ9YKT6_9EUKA|nr:hypothetical protein BLNAU_888 [Blattamonas nauphoetae]